MHLFIVSAVPDNSRVILVCDGRPSMRRVSFRDGKRGDILSCIDFLLKKKSQKHEALKGIVVITGPGHFSYLRTGISIANAFGFTLNIPVAGLTLDEFSTDKELVQKGERLLAKRKKFRPIMPAYGKEPNITVAKSQITSTK